MSEAAWLRPTKCPRLPGSVLKNVRGCLAPSSKLRPPNFHGNRLEFQNSDFARLLSSARTLTKSRYDPSRNCGGVSGQTFSVSEDAWLCLLSNYSKMNLIFPARYAAQSLSARAGSGQTLGLPTVHVCLFSVCLDRNRTL